MQRNLKELQEKAVQLDGKGRSTERREVADSIAAVQCENLLTE